MKIPEQDEGITKKNPDRTRTLKGWAGYVDLWKDRKQVSRIKKNHVCGEIYKAICQRATNQFAFV